MNTRVFNFEYTPPRPASLSSHLLLILVLGRSACGGRGPGGAGALPCGPLWPWTTPLPTQGGQPPCGRCRGMPTAAAAGTDALRVDKPAACPPSGCPTFEKLTPGGEKGLGVGHGQACGLPTPATVAPVPRNPSFWETEAAGCPCAERRTRGRSPGGQGACRPLLRRPLGPGRRPWGTWTPPSGGLLNIPRAA